MLHFKPNVIRPKGWTSRNNSKKIHLVLRSMQCSLQDKRLSLKRYSLISLMDPSPNKLHQLLNTVTESTRFIVWMKCFKICQCKSTQCNCVCLIMDLIDPPRHTANISVLFNALETLCFPHCITDMSQVYFSSVNVRKLCKYINFAVRRGLMRVDQLRMCSKQTERNYSESNIHFMIAVAVKGLL